MVTQTLDTQRLANALTRDHATRPSLRRRVAYAVLLLGVLNMVVMPLIDGEPQQIAAFRSANFWVRFTVFAGITLLLFVRARREERRVVQDAAAVASDLARDHERLTAPGWPWRVVAQGVLLALGIGVPMALLVIFVPAFDAGTMSERVRGGVLFILATLAWTIPAALIFRALSLRQLRKLLADG